MNKVGKVTICCLLTALLSGCAYRHYLGMHGPSVKAFPDIHAGITQDRECLSCHHPNQSDSAPPTSHPQFTGCLKCHNDVGK